ncbi:TolC family protein [uncultured Bacteroides sp.]|uniref:TolC family protein n=1 Tax=uncultured Bacteroides sp. TaxID=162156 RepID=UPI0026310CF6|nr:TolC family protein [uncultured Bacteroides sp.]
MRKFLCFISLACITIVAGAQEILSLDSCRALAIANNKELLISQEKINSAHYQRKAAFTNYLPDISATGGYMRTQKEISLLNNNQKSALSSMGTQVSGAMQAGIQNILTQNPGLAQNPQFMALIQTLGNIDVATPLNGLGNSLVDAFRTDTRNMYAGALTLTQPLYMGGKIRAYNKITRYAEELARQQHASGLQDVILSTDQAYWQVVSLASKKKLAEGYLKLLQKLEDDVNKMIAEGVATKADGLSVKVKVNEAEMTLTKVEDGLSLSRMLLCQLCGLDLSSPITLKDEQEDDLGSNAAAAESIDMNSVYAMRPEVRSLQLATEIYKQKINVTRSEYMPSLALMGSYMMTNPSVFNGFEKKFKGMWNVGVVLQVPIWHWGEGLYKVKAAKAEARIAQYQLDDAKEKIELQVNQSVFKMNEAAKKLTMAEKNLEKANENLRYATLGFEEGVIAASNVLEAHTAWLSAQSDKIDAQIDVKLADIYLKKAEGRLSIDN